MPNSSVIDLEADMKSLRINMGKRIKEIRLKKGFTQDGFASSLGIDRSHISNIERGKTSVSTPLLALICETHSINHNWLINGYGQMFYEGENILDITLLTSIIDKVEKSKVNLRSDKKAQLISLIYEDCIKNKTTEEEEENFNEIALKYIRLVLP